METPWYRKRKWLLKKLFQYEHIDGGVPAYKLEIKEKDGGKMPPLESNTFI
ncbi:hypothetical protein TUM4644_18140 [Shewanella colwelliana]|nr:hypothetical protein TUM4644_18140 [Shewanella colwelliana]